MDNKEVKDPYIKWKKFIKNGGDLYEVPEKYRNEEIYKLYALTTGDVFSIPEEFRMPEMYEKYITLRGGNIRFVPKEYINEELCYKYIENGGYIESVPKEFIKPELFKAFIKKGNIKNLKNIPKEYINEELCYKYLRNGGYLMRIPEEFITKEMCDKYIELGRDLTEIPDKYITKELCNKYIEKGGYVELIPKEYMTKEMCGKYFEKTKDLDGIPMQYITKEMCIEYLESKNNFSKISEEIQEKIVDFIIKDEEPLTNFYSYNKTRVLSRIILKTINDGLTKEQLMQKYDVGENTINTALEIIYDTDEKTYTKIEETFKKNQEKYNDKCYNTADKVTEIIKKLGPITKKGAVSGTTLNRKQRIKFSYLVGITEDIEQNIYDVYTTINEQKEKVTKYKEFLTFCKNQLGFEHKSPFTRDYIVSDDELIFAVFGSKWLDDFDENKFFKDNQGNEIKHTYIDNNGNEIILKEDDCDIITSYLKNNNIPLKECIVKEAIRKYINGNLEEFSKDLVSDNYLENKETNKNESKNNTL